MAKHVRGQMIGHKDNGEGYEFGQGAGFGDFYEGPLKMGELADNATITIHDGPHERVFTDSEVAELVKCGNAMSTAMYAYQMDVDDDPPQKHRDMMMRWEQAVIRLLDPA